EARRYVGSKVPRALVTVASTNGVASAAWASTYPVNVPTRCQRRNEMYTAVAMTIDGVRIGNIRADCMNRADRLPRNWCRPRAAEVPTTVARAAAQVATMNELRSESSHRSLVKKLR